MIVTALWERLDVPGHDAARLSATPEGWRLTGMAVFRHAGAPACLTYTVLMDAAWTTRSGRVQGYIGAAEVDRSIERTALGWTLDGEVQRGLDHLVDLDLGFTPATNLAQVRRLALDIGQAADLRVAWLDAGAQELVGLPQTYRRRDRLSYDYEAPTVPYRAVLQLAESGFVRVYPDLWRMVV